jgi:drug/metabolite transporter (DMT)-like permease
MTQAAVATHPVNSNLKGLLFVALAVFFYAATDALAKFLGPALPVLELIFVRNVFTLMIVFGIFWRSRHTFRTGRIGFHLARAALATLAMLFFFMAFKTMPLANAISVGMTAPVILVVLTSIFTSDSVDRFQWAAICTSFIAALVILDPSAETLSWQAVLPLSGAFALAGFMLTTRLLKAETQLSLLVFPPLLAIGATGLFMPAVWVQPSLDQWGYLMLFGVFGIGALYFRSMGYAIANPASVAPMEYSNLLWAAFFGFAVFHDVPSLTLVLGSIIIVVCNLFVAFRSRKA